MKRVAFAILLLLVPAAMAHAEYASSTPSSGARLATPPTQVVVVFTEPVEPGGTTVHVLNIQDDRVDLDDARFSADRYTVTVGVQPDLPAGPYIISWKTFSSTDGHTRRGTVGFAIGAYEPPPTSSGTDDRANPVQVASRGLQFAGMALVLGTALFLRLERAPLAARSFLLPGTALFATGTALLLLATMNETGLGVQGLLGTESGKTVVSRTVLAVGAVLIAALALRHNTRSGPWAATGLVLAAGFMASQLGHASAGGWTATVMDFLHLVATTAWVGGLVVFLSLLARRPGTVADQLRLGRRFGTWALVCVAVLWATGSLLTLEIAGWPTTSTLSTPWFQILALKVAVALLMVGLAAVNRFILLEEPRTQGFLGRLHGLAARPKRWKVRPLVANTHPGALRRAVAVEASLGAITLILAAVLTTISPPVQEESGLQLQGTGTSFDVQLNIAPRPSVGQSSVVTMVVADDGVPVTNATDCGRPTCVRVILASEAGNETHEAAWNGAAWQVEGLLWTRAGPAQLTVEASSDAVYVDRVVFTVTVAPNVSFK